MEKSNIQITPSDFTDKLTQKQTKKILTQVDSLTPEA